MKFEQRTAVVTGGAGEIGKALCRKLCEQGVSVALTDLSAERAEEAPSDKERANFCDGFSLRRDSASGCPADPGKQAEDARAAFDRLFS